MRLQLGNITGKYEAYGLERVEVLRGPASVLFGPNEPGGLVNLVSRRPSTTAGGEVRLSAGSFDLRQAEVTMRGPLDADRRWSYSLTGVLRDSDLQVDYQRNDRVFVAPALQWQPTDTTRITFLSSYQHDRTNGDEFLPYVGTATASAFGRVPRSRFTGEPALDRYNRTSWTVGYEIDHRINEAFAVRQNMRFGRVEYDWYQTYGLGLVAGRQDLIERTAYRTKVDASGIGVDTHGEARFTTGPLRHTVLAGIDYGRVQFGTDPYTGGGSALRFNLYQPAYLNRAVPLSPLASTVTTTETVGLYLQDQIRLGERWVATVGLRQDWYNQDVRNRRSDTETATDGDALTWRAGLTYRADNGLAPYVSYSESFNPETGVDFFGRPFRPTTGRQYEAGIKYQPTGRNSFIQAAVFDIARQNVRTIDPSNALNTVQTGEVTVRGVELEGVASLDFGLSLIAAVTWLDAEITRSNVAAERGRRPSGVAERLASAYLDYNFPVDSPARGLAVGAGVRHIGNSAVGNNNVALVPSATVFDASLRYDLSRFGKPLEGVLAQVNFRNLADTRYVATCTGLGACFYGERLSVIGTLAYRW